jgi:hypothetical protein
MTNNDDYKRFCLKCGWNDLDYGCTSPSGEDVYQCPMYIHYHPEEVKEFNEHLMNKR